MPFQMNQAQAAFDYDRQFWVPGDVLALDFIAAMGFGIPNQVMVFMDQVPRIQGVGDWRGQRGANEKTSQCWPDYGIGSSYKSAANRTPVPDEHIAMALEKCINIVRRF